MRAVEIVGAGAKLRGVSFWEGVVMAESVETEILPCA
jgi:hypothetical protein